MRAPDQPGRVCTPAELLAMPEAREAYELIHGRLAERQTDPAARRAGAGLCRLLADHEAVFGTAWILDADVGYHCFPGHPQTVLRPELSAMLRMRVPADWTPERLVELPPDLVAEVLTPAHGALELDARVDLWLAAGVRLVWVINPAMRSVLVARDDGSVNRLRDPEDLTGEAVLPGFTCRICDIFSNEQ